MSTSTLHPEAVSTLDLTEPRVIRFDDIVPLWNEALHSTDPGYLRWITAYIGGPPGHLHEHPATGLVGGHSLIGVMGLPVGQRQYGLHRHTTTEIYLIVQGRVESIEGHGKRQTLGPMDVLYIPVRSPHAVRAIGDEDVLLMFVHDEHEQIGLSKYVTDDDPSLEDPDPHPLVIRWDQLEPDWSAPGAREVGTLRYSVSWVGGGEGRINHNPGVAAHHDQVALGATVIPWANAEPPQSWGAVRCVQVIDGRIRVEGHPELGELGPLDLLVLPRDYRHALRPVGREGARYLWWHEDGVPANPT